MVIIFRFIFILTFLSSNCFGFVVQKFEMNPNKISAVKSLVNKVTRKDLKKDLKRFLSKSAPGRMVGTLGHKKALDYILMSIRDYDLHDTALTDIQSFSTDIEEVKTFYKKDFEKQIMHNLSPHTLTYKRWDNFTKSVLKSLDLLKKVHGKNIIWEKIGKEKPNEFLVIGVHYDTIAFDSKTMTVRMDNISPGADDNGSGIVIAMNLIRVLSAINLKRSVRIVFFDFQELGFNGSKAYVENSKVGRTKELWKGYINLEMLGHDSTILDKSKKSGNMKAYMRKKGGDGYRLDSQFANSFLKSGSEITRAVKFTQEPNGFNMSDHINFWPLNIPVLALTQDWENDLNPRYHTKNDFFETINFSTLHANYKYITGAVVAWAREIEVK